MLLIISIVLAIAIIVGIILQLEWLTDVAGAIISTCSGIALFFVLLFWGITYVSTVADIQTYYAVKETVKESRNAEIIPLERAALTNSIIEINSWLKRTQFWNSTILNQAIPDEVMKLKPIE